MSERTKSKRFRAPGGLLISAVVLGVIAGTALAQQLSAEKPPVSAVFLPEEYAMTTPLCSGLYEEEALREELNWQLGGGKLLTVAVSREGDETELLAVPTETLSARQAEALAYILVPADFAAQSLGQFAPPDPSLSEEALCRLRDDCYRLADRLSEVMDTGRIVDPRVVLPTSNGPMDYAMLWRYYDAYRARLIDWAETYCPVDKHRRLSELHDRVRSALEVECHSAESEQLRQARTRQLSEADRLLADAEAGMISADTAAARLDELWSNR